MKYINNKFFIEGKNIRSLTKKFNTPLYCYSYKNLRENIENFKKAFDEIRPLICFSVKSNSNISVLKEIKKLGLGADVVFYKHLMLVLAQFDLFLLILVHEVFYFFFLLN